MNRSGGPHFSISGSDRGKSHPPRPAFEYVDRLFRKDLEAVPVQVRAFIRESLAEVQYRTHGWANQDDYLRECMSDAQAVVAREGSQIERADFGDVFVRFFDLVETDKQRHGVDREAQLEEDLQDIQREMRYELGGRLRGEQGHVGRSGKTKARVVKKF